jgi:hypothetical protein
VRIKTLIASSSALIAAVVFAMASSASASTAASAHQNAGAPASALNAGGFENSAGQIAAEPASPQTPKNGQCAGVWSQAVANVVFQRAKTGGLSWGFFLTKVSQGILGSPVAVDITSATINNRAIHTPYSEHVQSSNYNFHSSLKNYEFIGSRVLHTIKTGDKLYLIWLIEGSSGEDAYRYVRCTIPQPGAH